MGIGSSGVVNCANTYLGTANYTVADGYVADRTPIVGGNGPAQLNLNFARNEVLDPRITFSRTSNATRTNDEVTYLSASPIASIDYVGIIFKPTGKILKDKEGLEYPEMKALDGYHVNLRLTELPETLPDALAPYIVEPISPSRVWA